jgi:hypothetical protein
MTNERGAKNDAEIAAKWVRLAAKMPPHGFDTVEEAEVYSWTLDAELGFWKPSKEVRT